MPTYNTTALENALQAKINALDSTATVSELINLLNTAQQFDTEIVYDSSGDLPTDSAFYGSILSTKSNNEYRNNFVYHNRAGSWLELQSLNTVGAEYYVGSVVGAVVNVTPNQKDLNQFYFSNDTSVTDIGDFHGQADQARVTAGTGSNTPGGTALSGYTQPGGVTVTNSWNVTTGSYSSNLGTLAPPISQRQQGTVISGLSNAYFAGGGNWPAGGTARSQIDRKSWTSPGAAVLVDNLASNRAGITTNIDTNSDVGYVKGGSGPGDPGNQLTASAIVDKFNTNSETTLTAIPSLGSTIQNGAATTSPTGGFIYGGRTTPASVNKDIEKFPFASESPSTNIATMTLDRAYRVTGVSEENFGYIAGGSGGSFNDCWNDIEKFSYASETPTSPVSTFTTITPPAPFYLRHEAAQV